MSTVRILQIFWLMHVENNTTKESIWAIKRTMKGHWVIEYIEKQFQKYFSLYAFVALTFQAKEARFVALQGFKIP
jgi:hypothetical protein